MWVQMLLLRQPSQGAVLLPQALFGPDLEIATPTLLPLSTAWLQQFVGMAMKSKPCLPFLYSAGKALAAATRLCPAASAQPPPLGVLLRVEAQPLVAGAQQLLRELQL